MICEEWLRLGTKIFKGEESMKLKKSSVTVESVDGERCSA